MAHKIVGYLASKQEVIGKRIFGQVSQTTWGGSETYRIGDNNNATKFAFIAIPYTGSSSSRLYEVYLWCNTTVTSSAQNFVQHYREYQGEVSETSRETVAFRTANAHGYRYAPMGVAYLGDIMLSNNNLPVLRDNSNVVNVYDGDAPSSFTDDPTLSAFVDEVFAHEITPPKGQGTAIISIPASGARLTFTSAELSVSKTVFVDSDATIDMEE